MAISINIVTKTIDITTPTTEVTIQELVDYIRDWEDELPNLCYEKVIDAVGKADLGGGVVTGIVMTLNSLWQIQFWGGSGYTMVKGGTLIGGIGNEPIKATGTANDITIQIQPTDATITTGTGSSPEDIADAVWDEQTSGHTDSGSFGDAVGSGAAGEKDWTAGERSQIRDALGIDGNKISSVGGVLQKIKSGINAIIAFIS